MNPRLHARPSPLVSVLVNNYNYARFLPDALDSALRQTYDNIEIVVVDDGSTDDSTRVINDFAARDARVIPVFKVNGGQASAFNAGVAAAKGDILCFLDADDSWHESKVQRVVEAHATHAFVQHNVEKNGRPLFVVPSNRFNRARLMTKYGYLYVFAPTSALSLTSDLARRVFPIPEDGLRLCADLFVAFGACYFEGVHTIGDCLGLYRIHDANGWQQRPRTTVDDGPRKYFEVLERVNRWLFARGHYPIPTFNDVLNERMLADVLQLVPDDDYIVWGTGQMSEFICELIDSHGGRVKTFVDSSPAKWGTELRGRPVVGPGDLDAVVDADDRVVIGSMFVADILETLARHGLDPERAVYPPFLFQPPQRADA